MPDTGIWIQDSGFSILDTGSESIRSKIQDTGPEILRGKIFDIEKMILDHRSIDSGFLVFEIGACPDSYRGGAWDLELETSNLKQQKPAPKECLR